MPELCTGSWTARSVRGQLALEGPPHFILNCVVLYVIVAGIIILQYAFYVLRYANDAIDGLRDAIAGDTNTQHEY